MSELKIVAAPDKFKGTATAAEVAAAIALAVDEHGGSCIQVPLADGGEGTLEVLGGANRTSEVSGPLGSPVEAAWRLADGTAVIEMAQAAGLVLAGGRAGNDPLKATTRGVGELIVQAVDEGAERIIVGVGGSATTDGGLGAVEAIGTADRLQSVDVLVACDVRTLFTDAGPVFGPQKGASLEQVVVLTERLLTLSDRYYKAFGVDVSSMQSAGAAGGLAGGLAALGARLVDGFELVADVVSLEGQIEGADLVITGEGGLDDESFNGKVVGGVYEIAARHGVPVLAVAGQIVGEPPTMIDAISLTEEFGQDRAMQDPTGAVKEAVATYLASKC